MAQGQSSGGHSDGQGDQGRIDGLPEDGKAPVTISGGPGTYRDRYGVRKALEAIWKDVDCLLPNHLVRWNVEEFGYTRVRSYGLFYTMGRRVRLKDATKLGKISWRPKRQLQFTWMVSHADQRREACDGGGTSVDGGVCHTDSGLAGSSSGNVIRGRFKRVNAISVNKSGVWAWSDGESTEIVFRDVPRRIRCTKI